METEIKTYECKKCAKAGSFSTPKLKKYARCSNCGSSEIFEIGTDALRLLRLVDPASVTEDSELRKR